MKKKIFIIIILIGLAGAGWAYYNATKDVVLKRDSMEIISVDRGLISREITANGTIQPINVVSVGTQVSGIVETVLADYNDEVEKDQLLARIDTYLLEEEVNSAKARLALADVKMKIARLNLERSESLFNDDYIAKAELEASQIELEAARTEYSTAESTFKKAERNMGYAEITSPVSGTVISKEVEKGQTVAASFQTPTLFTIAEDLRKMQIEASISEADIGNMKNGMEVSFTVDAYPKDTFKGVISQVRLNPETVQNVVMYTVVMQIENEEKKLLPGMTAFVTVKIEERLDALRVPNLALQFRLPQSMRAHLSKEEPKDLGPDEIIVYKFANGKIEPKKVTRGINDVVNTEIVSGLSEGEEIISEFLGKTDNKKK